MDSLLVSHPPGRPHRTYPDVRLKLLILNEADTMARRVLPLHNLGVEKKCEPEIKRACGIRLNRRDTKSLHK